MFIVIDESKKKNAVHWGEERHILFSNRLTLLDEQAGFHHTASAHLKIKIPFFH